MSQSMHAHGAQHVSEPGAFPVGWLVVLAVLLVGAIYLRLMFRQWERGRAWPLWRAGSAIAGCVLLAWAVSPPVSELAHNDMRWHMVQHLAVGMFAPLGLVLAAPLTLLLRSVPVSAGRTLVRCLHVRPVRLLSHPVSALVLNVGGMFVLYLTPLFAWSHAHSALHWLVLVHFLAAGYLFAWAIAGPDAVAQRPGTLLRTSVLLVSVGLHAFLSKYLYAHQYPRGVPFDSTQMQDAAVLMYYGGDIAELLLAAMLFGSWFQARQRQRVRQGQRQAVDAARPATPTVPATTA